MTIAVVFLALTLLAESVFASGEPWLPSSDSARLYAERALRTQTYTMANLALGNRCGAAGFLGFRREAGSNLSDTWYVASQLMADAVLLRLGDKSSACSQLRTVAFLDLVAQPKAPGGYYPRSDVDARNATTRDLYADDNALLGLAFLEARTASTDKIWRSELLDRAAGTAQYLIESELWDNTFGGGFWWNTTRGSTPEGKPTQTTALAGLLFGRLYEETADPSYATWSRRCLLWLDGRVQDPNSGLYNYGLRWWDPLVQNRPYLDPRSFGYDQGIMIELHLLFDRSIEPRSGHLARAQSLAEGLQTEFWLPERGGYKLQSGLDDIYAAYSAWITPSLLALYAVDRNPSWLERARGNLDALDTYLLDPADNGYFQMQHHCQVRTTPGCEWGASWVSDPTKLLFSQAWLQRAQAMLAETLAKDNADFNPRAQRPT